VADDKKKKKGGGGSVLKLLLLLIVVVVVAFVGYGFTLESKPHFERSVVIKADPDDVHEWVGDLKKWDEWGPWRDEDPNMKYTYSETTTEVGSKMSWTMEQGSGALWITKTDPKTGVSYKFQWEDWEPTDGSVTYTEQEDGTTKVTWSFDADMGMNLFGRYAMHFGREGMEEMFQKGLNKLKIKLESN